MPSGPHRTRLCRDIRCPEGYAEGEKAMDMPRVVSREEWLAARKDLLAKEKEVTRAKDAVAAARRALPMTEVGNKYVFTGPTGQVGLADLFDGRRQLSWERAFPREGGHESCR